MIMKLYNHSTVEQNNNNGMNNDDVYMYIE